MSWWRNRTTSSPRGSNASAASARTASNEKTSSNSATGSEEIDAVTEERAAERWHSGSDGTVGSVGGGEDRLTASGELLPEVAVHGDSWKDFQKIVNLPSSVIGEKLTLQTIIPSSQRVSSRRLDKTFSILL
jgi:hypothetical protein